MEISIWILSKTHPSARKLISSMKMPVFPVKSRFSALFEIKKAPFRPYNIIQSFLFLLSFKDIIVCIKRKFAS